MAKELAELQAQATKIPRAMRRLQAWKLTEAGSATAVPEGALMPPTIEELALEDPDAAMEAALAKLGGLEARAVANSRAKPQNGSKGSKDAVASTADRAAQTSQGAPVPQAQRTAVAAQAKSAIKVSQMAAAVAAIAATEEAAEEKMQLTIEAAAIEQAVLRNEGRLEAASAVAAARAVRIEQLRQFRSMQAEHWLSESPPVPQLHPPQQDTVARLGARSRASGRLGAASALQGEAGTDERYTSHEAHKMRRPPGRRLSWAEEGPDAGEGPRRHESSSDLRARAESWSRQVAAAGGHVNLASKLRPPPVQHQPRRQHRSRRASSRIEELRASARRLRQQRDGLIGEEFGRLLRDEDDSHSDASDSSPPVAQLALPPRNATTAQAHLRPARTEAAKRGQLRDTRLNAWMDEMQASAVELRARASEMRSRASELRIKQQAAVAPATQSSLQPLLSTNATPPKPRPTTTPSRPQRQRRGGEADDGRSATSLTPTEGRSALSNASPTDREAAALRQRLLELATPVRRDKPDGAPTRSPPAHKGLVATCDGSVASCGEDGAAAMYCTAEEDGTAAAIRMSEAMSKLYRRDAERSRAGVEPDEVPRHRDPRDPVIVDAVASEPKFTPGEDGGDVSTRANDREACTVNDERASRAAGANAVAKARRQARENAVAAARASSTATSLPRSLGRGQRAMDAATLESIMAEAGVGVDAVGPERSAVQRSSPSAVTTATTQHSKPSSPPRLELPRVRPGQTLWIASRATFGVVQANNPFFKVMHLMVDGGTVEMSYNELRPPPAASIASTPSNTGGHAAANALSLSSAIADLEQQVRHLATELADTTQTTADHAVARALV